MFTRESLGRKKCQRSELSFELGSRIKMRKGVAENTERYSFNYVLTL
jgi:hypothetical protein